MSEVVKKFMTKNLVQVSWGTSLYEAEQLMDEKRIRHLPVISPEGEALGIVSKRNIAGVIGSKMIPVERVMKSPVEFVYEELPLRSAIFKMLENKISCLLVANEQNMVTGIITTDDLLWHLAELLPAEEAERAADKIAAIKDRAIQTIGDLANKLAAMGI